MFTDTDFNDTDFSDIEETLGRELHQVADELEIPAVPPMPAADDRPARRWQPVLVAAAAAAVIAGTVAVVVSAGNHDNLAPAPAPTPTAPTATAPTTTGTPAPTPTATATLPRSAPTIPYVLENKLYVDGQVFAGQVDGQVVADNWCCVSGTNAGWLALHATAWWWGNRALQEPLRNLVDVPPVISPDGKLLAYLYVDKGKTYVTGFTTRVGGEGQGGFELDPGDPALGDPVRVRAVTNDYRIVVQGQGQSWLWLPQVGMDATVDLNETAPDAVFVGATPAGLIVTDDSNSEYYLASLSDTGELTRLATLPLNDDIAITPDGQWAVYVPQGSLGGEVGSLSSLEAQTVDGTQHVTLTPPDGWQFRVHTWAWENDDHVIAAVIGDPGERMARCSVRLGRCALIDAG